MVGQGMCEETVKVFWVMEEEGIEPNLIMLNSLINAFGIAGRCSEAMSIFEHLKEIVRCCVHCPDHNYH